MDTPLCVRGTLQFYVRKFQLQRTQSTPIRSYNQKSYARIPFHGSHYRNSPKLAVSRGNCSICYASYVHMRNIRRDLSPKSRVRAIPYARVWVIRTILCGTFDNRYVPCARTWRYSASRRLYFKNDRARSLRKYIETLLHLYGRNPRLEEIPFLSWRSGDENKQRENERTNERTLILATFKAPDKLLSLVRFWWTSAVVPKSFYSRVKKFNAVLPFGGCSPREHACSFRATPPLLITILWKSSSSVSRHSRNLYRRFSGRCPVVDLSHFADN